MNKYVISALATDFDETITKKDTINPLVRLAITQSGQLHNRLRDWLALSQWYQSHCSVDINSFFCNFSSLEDFAVHYHDTVEMVALRKVISQRFLIGLKKIQLRQLGQQTPKKPLAEQVLAKLRANSVRIEILSANWSTDLIIGAMEGLCDRVTANDLLFDNQKPATTTGEIQLKVTSAQHKQKRIKWMMETYGKTAYIGDSITDLLAICTADIGLLIGNNRMVRQALAHFKIPLIEIKSGQHYLPNIHSGLVICLQSWSEVDFFLSGTKRRSNHEPSHSSL